MTPSQKKRIIIDIQRLSEGIKVQSSILVREGEQLPEAKVDVAVCKEIHRLSKLIIKQ